MAPVSIVSYNVNGIRAALKKGLNKWIKQDSFDIVCLQELKAMPDQFDITQFAKLGYQHFWFPSQKKGYSGVAILSKAKPQHVEYGCGNPDFDTEGRVIRADFDSFSMMNIYFPSGSSGAERQQVKFRFLDFVLPYIQEVQSSHPNLIVAGDYNICHENIDIHDPVGNKNSSGFLPEERAWMSKFFDTGFIDSFRHLHKEPGHYSWWSYRSNARAKNKGWRIDYLAVSPGMEKTLREAFILDDVYHSDHCPVFLKIII